MDCVKYSWLKIDWKFEFANKNVSMFFDYIIDLFYFVFALSLHKFDAILLIFPVSIRKAKTCLFSLFFIILFKVPIWYQLNKYVATTIFVVIFTTKGDRSLFMMESATTWKKKRKKKSQMCLVLQTLTGKDKHVDKGYFDET